MGLFNNFPYPDTHQLNLDWILNSVKELSTYVKERVDGIQKALTDAQAAATAAENSATSAQTFANNAQDSATLAQDAATAQPSAQQAQAAATAAKTSATSAQTFANNAQTSATSAQASAENAQMSVTQAQTFANNARTSANSAQTFANNAQDSATSAQDAATIAQASATKLADILLDNAGAHNAIYRGKNLGTSVTSAQWDAISTGSFTDMYIGDYWEIGGLKWRIASFDYYLRSGDTDMTTHHVTLVPDTSMYSHVMNNSDVTTGGYVGSKMYTTGLSDAKKTINNYFGSAHILMHRQYLCNSVTNGKPSGGTWFDSTVELMTEQNVYGGKVFGIGNDGNTIPALYTSDKSQYPLFAFRPDLISNRTWFWLRDVVSDYNFANVGADGNANCDHASRSGGVRPAFSIKS